LSEPCRHEREFAGTQADTLTSFVKSNAELVKAQAELLAARATIAKIAAIVADPAAALVADRVRAALDLREQGTSETEPVSSPDLHPRNSTAVGSELMPNTNNLTPMCCVHHEHFMPCSRCRAKAVNAADDRRSL